jgi:hypothetical protein
MAFDNDLITPKEIICWQMEDAADACSARIEAVCSQPVFLQQCRYDVQYHEDYVDRFSNNA